VFPGRKTSYNPLTFQSRPGPVMVRPMHDSPHTLVIGCGNRLCGDDAAGPELVRLLLARGLPAGMRCLDAATDGVAVIEAMRHVPSVILVDACASGAEPGTILELTDADVETPPPGGVSVHAIRWNHALVLARQLLGPSYPPRVTIRLISGQFFQPADALSPAVVKAVERLADQIVADVAVA
jgi:hydrogenase maturation protease